ncbi:4-alpha-glucanotransferase [Kutzneria albida]|uniref:4-alpha-glucanotransferase n=1 Tax=Kutzneria albida DSM 43870 TaxID=1449976 RepID=W5W6E1_9PSEU|nr:4-alpha-glucanotransferase [Kutzneria albida]AHH96477.1 4-alpha-glucanotransferase [Kutzneria albida DSM 43870]
MDDLLVELAAAHGVATWYEGSQRRRVEVDAEVVVAVLAQLGVTADTPEQVRAELARVRAEAAGEALPPTVVLRAGDTRALPGDGQVRTEDGQLLTVGSELPADLPLGWHTLHVGEQTATLVVAPAKLPEPPRAWGWMVQLYALHSARSWGVGDLADLRELVGWAGGTGAGVVLLNPLHAVAPVHPIQPSPYSPSSRRFTNPIYLRVDEVPEYALADESTRARVDALAVSPDWARIDYDAVWRAKIGALELLWPYAEKSTEDSDFAVYSALAERHGADWRDWPEPLRHPENPAVAAARTELADRIAFHGWLQRLCDRQLAQAQQAARDSGMAVGIVHDLPVGVDPGGADAWALQDVLATGVTVGAPPDAFNQQGQNWSLPPWHPRELARAGYRPYRDLVRAVFRHSDGMRIDHIAGLWRLWWIPPGGDARRGTYVHYDAEAMLGILALEAHRAGAVVVGEDLGTVEPVVTRSLHERNMLSSAVLWFERDVDAPGEPLLEPQRWPELATASVSTHDLPTAAGFLRGEHVRVRAELGVLAGDVESEQDNAAREREELLALMRRAGVLTEDASEQDTIVAMHALLARTPCRFVLASPYDVIGEPRQPNLPGTVSEYPNWKIPFPVHLAEFTADPRVRRAIEALRAP